MESELVYEFGIIHFAEPSLYSLQEENELNRTGPTQAKPRAKTETGDWDWARTSAQPGNKDRQ